jgi:hypothetical protein
MNTNLGEIVNAARPGLLAITEGKASEQTVVQKWSRKQILGHLIDSAANNHQRIVRMQANADIGKLTYDQEHWVKSQHYGEEPWENMVGLWCSYNLHLAHVISHVDSTSLSNTCDMGYETPATLRFVIEDYIRHVQHHLEQIFSEAGPLERQRWVRRRPS